MLRRSFLKATAISLLSCFGIGKKAFAQLLAQVSGSPPITPRSTEALQPGGGAEPLAEQNTFGDINTVIKDVEVLRTEDLLNLRFEFVNLNVKRGNGEARLERLNPSQPAFIRVIFPSQHIAEETFDLNHTIPTRPLVVYSAGPSRLVFRIPDGINSIPYNIANLLNWANWSPALSATAIGNRSAKISKPTGLVTAIEAPYRLILSPDSFGRWEHSMMPLSHEYRSVAVISPTIKTEQRVELWHTRLRRKPPADTDTLLANPSTQPAAYSEIEDALPPLVRAIWTPDYKDVIQAGDVECGKTVGRVLPLMPDERVQIVHLSSNPSLDFAAPITAKHLMLSSLGAWLDVRGDWKVDNLFGLESWTNRTTMGRDHYVRVICKGYLIPFGHRVSLITITERRIEDDSNKAYLRFRQFIVVREAEKQYKKSQTSDSEAKQGRELPFRSVRIKTLVTPILNPAPDQANGWLMVNNKDFLFHLEAEDWEGQRSEFVMPLKYAENTKVEAPISGTPWKPIIDEYNSASNVARREVPWSAQKIAFAPSQSKGDTTYETESVTFMAGTRTPTNSGELYFYPAMDSAKVRLESASQISGQNTSINISYFDTYIDNAFNGGNHQGFIFAEVDPAVPITFPGNRTGGCITPNMAIRGLSRRFGVIGGDIENNGTSNPGYEWEDDLKALAAGNLAGREGYFTRYFEQAKILGGIELGKIISQDFGGGKNIPQLVTAPVFNQQGELIATNATFNWQPDVISFGPFVTKANTRLDISSSITAPLDGGEPSTYTRGELSNFVLNIFDVMKLKFGSFIFSVKDREKPDFDVRDLQLGFQGPLAIIRALESLIESNSFSDPPSMEISSDAVKLGYTLAIPSVMCGVFSLEGIAFGTALRLPFNGDPMTLGLNFADRSNPFVLSVAFLGGGGFFAISMRSDRLENVEGALEFGGHIAFDVGVARGGIELMGGVYFNLKLLTNEPARQTNELATQTTAVDFMAYVRLAGSLRVLGLISASVQVLVGLEHQPDNSIAGVAWLTIEVDLAFFSTSVDVPFSQSYQGSSPANKESTVSGLLNNGITNVGSPEHIADESEAELEQQWVAYCAAFAPDTEIAA